jgi:RNA polymerase sigma factor (sigma-70 family)
MGQDLETRGYWLERNVLPYEPYIRARLCDIRVQGLDVDDVIQEMYARILSGPVLETIRYPRQYAVQTARSIIIDYMRHSQVVSITSSGSIEQLNVPSQEANAEERHEFQAEIQEVANVLALLPKACRETLIMRRVEGLSLKETAVRLSISEKTVEKHTTRGIMMLMELFGRGGKNRVRSSKPRDEVSAKDESVESGDL